MPYTGIVLTIVALIAGFYLIQLSHWLVAAGLFPRAVEAFETQYTKRPVRATLVGLFTFGPLLVVMLMSANIPNPLIRLVGIGGFLVALLIAFAGSAGLALRIGNGLCPDASRWQKISRGGSMLSLCCITPLIGTFIALPLTLCSGFGSFLLARPWKNSVPVLAETPAPSLS